MVQVLKDPIGTKGARLSTQISASPDACWCTCRRTSHIGISQRIGEEAEREKLRARVQALLPADEPGGYIVRTMAEDASDEELAADIAYLRKMWQEIKSRSVGALPPALLHQDLTLAQRVLRDLVNADHRASSSTRARTSRSCAPSPRNTCRRWQPARALHRRAAAVRPARRRGRDPEGAGAPRRPQVRRLPDFRPDRGDDHHRRQHRRLRRLAQFRRHHLQDQPRGGADHRPPAPAAQPRRHHHRSTSSTWRARSTRPPCWPSSTRPWRATTRASRCPASPARPGRDDPQAHPRVLAHVLCEPCPTCGGRGEVKTARP
jgi:hypothetical protein